MKHATRLISLLLVLLLCIGLFPTSAFAEYGDVINVWVGGIQMKVGYYLPSGNNPTESSLTAAKPSGGYAYMKDSTTLVLHDYRYAGEGNSGRGVHSWVGDKFSLVIEGENYIKGSSFGICFTYGEITVSSPNHNGTLTAIGEEYYGMYSNYRLTVKDTTVTAEGFYKGIYGSANGDDGLFIQDATVTATGSLEGLDAKGGGISISGSTVYATGTESYGIAVSIGDIVICDYSDVTATGGRNGICCYDASGTIVLSNSTVTAIGKIGAMGTKPNLSGFSDTAVVRAGAAAASAVKVTDLANTDYHKQAYVNIRPAYLVEPCEDYSDIDRNAWYHDAVDYVLRGGYMGSTRTDKLTFEPTTKVSRSMVAQIMYNICGTPAVTYAGKFTDVPNGKWFTPAVEWCAQNGLAAGSDGKFNPNGNVTRQELTVFMMNLANYLDVDTTGRANLSGFPDADKVPTWAKEEMQWAVSYGLISGQQVGDKTYLNPAAGATRAELATILENFLTKY